MTTTATNSAAPTVKHSPVATLLAKLSGPAVTLLGLVLKGAMTSPDVPANLQEVATLLADLLIDEGVFTAAQLGMTE